jgi:gliding motility-associated-like protein
MVTKSCKKEYTIIGYRSLLKKYFYISLIFLLQPLCSIAQVDTAFWMALPTAFENNQLETQVKMSSTIGGGMYEYNFYVTNSNDEVKRVLKANAFMNYSGILTGIRGENIAKLIPDKDISSVAMLFKTPVLSTAFLEFTNRPNFNSELADIYSLKGFNGLGTHFVAPFQNQFEYDPSRGASVLDVVATEDNTALIVTPSNNLKNGKPAKIPFAIKMSRGQSYRMESASYMLNQSLQGTILKSNKPIAVTMSHYGVRYENNQIGFNGDQLVPVEVLSGEYILVKGRYEDRDALGNSIQLDRYFITAVYNDTKVYVAGNLVATLNAGESYNRNFDNTSLAEYVKTTYPVYVYQLSSMGNKPGGAIVPGINCNGNSSVSAFLPSSHLVRENEIENKPNHDFYKTKFGIMIFISSGGENHFLTSNNPMQKGAYAFPMSATDFAEVPGSNGAWKYAFYDLTKYTYTTNLKSDWSKALFRPGYGNLNGQDQIFYRARIENTQKNFHAAMLSGQTNGGKLAYFTNFIDLKLPDTANVGCSGDSVYLYAGASGSYYNWTYKDPINQTVINIGSGRYVYAKKPGLYIVEKKTENCDSKDSTLVIFEQPKLPFIGNDTVICNNLFKPFDLKVSDNYIYYRWNKKIANNKPNFRVDSAGTYVLETIDENFCMKNDTILIRTIKPRLIELGKDTTFCGITPYAIRLPAQNNYTWYPTQRFPNPNSSSQTFGYGFNEKISVRADSMGCLSFDTISISSGREITINPYQANVNLCTKDSVLIGPVAKANQTYQWIPSFALSKPNVTPSWYKQSYEGLTVQQFLLKVKEINNPCTVDLRIDIAITPNPNFQIQSNIKVCKGNPVEIDLDPSYTYLWKSNPIISRLDIAYQYILPTSNTTLEFDSKNGLCATSEKINIEVLPKPSLLASTNQEICPKDSIVINLQGAIQYAINNSPLFTQNQVILFPEQSTDFFITGYDANGCDSTSILSVAVKNAPIIKTVEEKKICFFTDSLSLTELLLPESTRDFKVYIDQKIYSKSNIDQYGTYVFVSGNSECTNSDTVKIIQACPEGVYIPKSFSPNHDGHNDQWVILYNHTELKELQVFNRWGELIFNSQQSTDIWDGTLAGKDCVEGLYPYILKYTNQSGQQLQQSGSVVLIR